MEINQKIILLRKMLRVRYFEEAAIEKKEKNIIFGPVHTTIGQEAVDVGVCSGLSKEDYIIGTHRPHGYMLGKGADADLMMAELYGKSTGTNGGKGGSMHVSDKSIGSLGASSIVGSGLPIACGAGFASKYRNDKKITCVFFGDGAAHEGTFHESLNLASIWKLPVLFLLKNNGLAVTTTLQQTSLMEDFYTRASLYNMPGYKIDGQDVEAVYERIGSVAQYIREGNGPVLVEAKTIRFREHQEGVGYRKIANSNYRDNEKVAHDLKNNDPILNYKNKLILENVITLEDFLAISADEESCIRHAVKFAEDSPMPKATNAYTNIYAGAV